LRAAATAARLPGVPALATRVYALTREVSQRRLTKLAKLAGTLLDTGRPVTLASLARDALADGLEDDAEQVADAADELAEAGLAPVARAIRETLRRHVHKLHTVTRDIGAGLAPDAERDRLQRAVHDLAERAVRLVGAAARVRRNVNHLAARPLDDPLSTAALDAIGQRLGLVDAGTPLDPATLVWLVNAIDLARDLYGDPSVDGGMVGLDAVTKALGLMRLLRPRARATAAAELAGRVRAELTDLEAMLDDLVLDALVTRRDQVGQLSGRLRELRGQPVGQRLAGLRTLAR